MAAVTLTPYPGFENGYSFTRPCGCKEVRVGTCAAVAREARKVCPAHMTPEQRKAANKRENAYHRHF